MHDHPFNPAEFDPTQSVWEMLVEALADWRVGLAVLVAVGMLGEAFEVLR